MIITPWGLWVHIAISLSERTNARSEMTRWDVMLGSGHVLSYWGRQWSYDVTLTSHDSCRPHAHSPRYPHRLSGLHQSYWSYAQTTHLSLLTRRRLCWPSSNYIAHPWLRVTCCAISAGWLQMAEAGGSTMVQIPVGVQSLYTVVGMM